MRHYTFDSDYAYPKGDIDGVRRQLNAPGWSRIVEARSKKDNTNVDVFVLIDGEKAQGLAIIASEPREFTIVNIVGNIDLEQLHDLEGNFGVPDLEIETGKKPAPAPDRDQPVSAIAGTMPPKTPSANRKTVSAHRRSSSKTYIAVRQCDRPARHAYAITRKLARRHAISDCIVSTPSRAPSTIQP